MMIKKTLSRSEYNVIYSGMGGVDLSGDGSDISKKRFAYLENMYRDYEGDGAGIIESIPGYRRILDIPGKCNGLYHYKNSDGEDIIACHFSNKLYEFVSSDIDTSPTLSVTEGIRNSKSSAFVFGDSVYIMDGLTIYKLSSSYKSEISDTDGNIYIPTTHINGIAAEQRNLLTRFFYEKYIIGSSEKLAYGSTELKYVITDEEKKLCRVTLNKSINAKSLYIPAVKKIGETLYTVTDIAPSAFSGNSNITTCTIAAGTVSIGAYAFSDCKNLTEVILPDTVYSIGEGAFMNCAKLTRIHIGMGLADLGFNSLNSCPSLEEITYSGTETDFDLIENASAFSDKVSFNTENSPVVIEIPINNPCNGIESVTVGSTDFKTYIPIVKYGICKSIRLSFSKRSDIEGKTVIIKGTLTSLPEYYMEEGYGGFVASVHNADLGSVAEIIKRCTVGAIFDGRVFLSGNPRYPGYIFYSSFDSSGESNPLYFGEFNYFRDGAGDIDIISMLNTGDALAVFKESDDGSGSIFCHIPKEIEDSLITKIYPVAYTHHGFPAMGESISFFDDPLFISEKGISSLEKETLNLERKIATRSSNINPRFLTEDIKNAHLAVWRGYLAVSIGGNIYLADSRDTFKGKEGNTEYEWYFLSGIGAHTDDSTVYRYSSSAHEGFHVHDACDMPASGEIMSVASENEIIYYVSEDSKRYEVYPTEEKEGGSFTPATHLLALGELLFFSGDSGGLYLFNNDKRGIAPPTVTDSEDYDEDDYKKTYGRRIHHYYYSFDNHAPRYALKTAKDNCGIPHLRKNTVKHSLTLKCRAVASGSICCEVGSDAEGYSEICSFPNKDMVFSDMDFSLLCLSTSDIYTVPVKEKAKGWIEKQISIYTDRFASPFGIYTIAYRFYIKGKIKKST